MTAYIVLLAVVAAYLALREGRWISVTAMLLGALLVLYGGGHLYYYDRSGLQDRVAERVTLALSLMWVGLIVGVELARAAAPAASALRSTLLRTWQQRPVVLSTGDRALWRLLALALIGYLAVMFLLLGKAQQVLEFMTLDTELAKREFRLAAGAQGGYLLGIVLAAAAPFVALYMSVSAVVTRRRDDIAIAAALCAIVFLFKVGSFHKAQWVWFLVQLMLAMRLLRSPRANLPWLIGGVAAFTAALLVGAQFAYPELDVLGLWGFLTYRVFEITNEGLYQFMYVYPEYIPHAYGMNVGLLHTLFGEGEFVAAHTRVAQFFGSFDATNNAVFVADAWVEFGYAGVLGAALVVGAVVKSIDVLAATLGRSPVAIALVAFSFYGVITLCSTSAFTALLTGGLLSVPLLIILVRSLSRSLGNELALRRSLHSLDESVIHSQ